MFLVALDGFDDLDDLLARKPDGVILGIRGLSARSRAVIDADQLRQAVDWFAGQGIQTYVNAQAMIEQSRLSEIRPLFEQVLQAEPDGIYIADDGYLALAEQLKPGSRNRLIVQPETLLCSGEDICFYARSGVQAASLSHELSADEILEAAACCQAENCLPALELLAAGHFSWMESRRPLIENYLRLSDQTEQFEPDRLYTIQEQMRSFQLPVWQDELGTHILSAEPMMIGRDLLRFSRAGISRYRIDALLKGNRWAVRILQAMQEALDGDPEALGPYASNLPGHESLIVKPKAARMNPKEPEMDEQIRLDEEKGADRSWQ